MKPKLFRIILPVSDIERAARFYETVLDIKGMRVSNGRHYLDCDGTILACFDPNADGDHYKPTPLSEWLYFAVDNIESLYERFKTAGGTLSKDDVHGAASGEIIRRPWGERSFYGQDPFGNKLCFVDRSTLFRG